MFNKEWVRKFNRIQTNTQLNQPNQNKWCYYFLKREEKKETSCPLSVEKKTSSVSDLSASESIVEKAEIALLVTRKTPGDDIMENKNRLENSIWRTNLPITLDHWAGGRHSGYCFGNNVRDQWVASVTLYTINLSGSQWKGFFSFEENEGDLFPDRGLAMVKLTTSIKNTRNVSTELVVLTTYHILSCV